MTPEEQAEWERMTALITRYRRRIVELKHALNVARMDRQDALRARQDEAPKQARHS